MIKWVLSPVDGRAEDVFVEEDEMGRVGGEGGGEVAGDLGPAAHHAGHLAGQDWKVKKP